MRRRLVFRRQIDGEARPPNGDVGRQRPMLHLLPCKIRPDKVAVDNRTQTAPVDRYFCPYAKNVTTTTSATVPATSDIALWHASFRGKPLTGVQLGMPDNYVGVLCNGTGDRVEPDDSSDLMADEVTEQLMYWNWDRIPTREDPLLAAFDWVRVSEAMMLNDD